MGNLERGKLEGKLTKEGELTLRIMQLQGMTDGVSSSEDLPQSENDQCDSVRRRTSSQLAAGNPTRREKAWYSRRFGCRVFAEVEVHVETKRGQDDETIEQSDPRSCVGDRSKSVNSEQYIESEDT